LPAKPESLAREKIDRQLTDAGWIVQDRAAANLSAGPGVAVVYVDKGMTPEQVDHLFASMARHLYGRE